MPAARVFAHCASCGHAAMARAGAACGLCGGALAEQEPPADLFGGWRCVCVQCASTPC